LQAQLEEMELRLDEMERRLQIIKGERNLVIDNPHTVWTVANVLDLDLTRNQRKDTGLLAYKLFKYMHANNEPAHYAMFGMDTDVNRYGTGDLWMVRIAVKRVFEGAVCVGPSEETMSNEVWLQCCTEVKHDDDSYYDVL
jgi:hypothetical protein